MCVCVRVCVRMCVCAYVCGYVGGGMCERARACNVVLSCLTFHLKI